MLGRHKLDTPPPQSAATYASGVLALVGTYGLQSTVVNYLEQRGDGTSTRSPPPTAAAAQSSSPKKKSQPFVPPKNMGELFNRAGRPVLIRLGATFVAFFCAGAIQTFAALPPRG